MERADWLLTPLSGGIPRRGWTAVMATVRRGPRATTSVPCFARELRLSLNLEHLDREGDEEAAALCDLGRAFAAYAESAAALDAWHADGRHGPRPPGRLRTYHPPHLSRITRALTDPLYRVVVDPDGRPRSLRRRGAY
ncbi:hypothetical protein [Streptomyces aureus]|uniref:hypothetical protein n=1 Tax=Streptomyces aureus TaxID=193461 RepID=UPI0033D8F8FB